MNIRFAIIILLGLIVFLSRGYAQSPTNSPNNETKPSYSSPGIYRLPYPTDSRVNYVRTREAKGRYPSFTYEAFNAISDFTTIKEVTQYFDGLGRPLQIVARQQTPGPQPKDIITPFIYDAFGREDIKMPTYFNLNSDLGKLDRDITTNFRALETVYPDEHVFFSKITFEASPLNRILKVNPPGNSWSTQQPVDRSIKTEYLVNSVSDAVRIWNISFNDLLFDGVENNINIPSTGGSDTYAVGELFKTVTKDEQNNTIVEYKDKDDKVILKKVQIGAIPSDYGGYNNFLCTYYVYDDFDQLRFVIPPKAVEAIKNSWSLSEGIVQELCFRYEFDERKRLIAKKVPGADWVYMIYDKRDRLVYTQDGNMRERNQWHTTLYDELNRPVLTGMITYAGTRNQLQSFVDQNTGGGVITQQAFQMNFSNDLFVFDRPVNSPPQQYVAASSITFTGDFESESSADFDAHTAGPQNGATTQTYITDNPIPSGVSMIGLTITTYDAYPNNARVYSTADNSKLDHGNNPNVESLPAAASQQLRGLVTETKVRVLENPDDLNAGNWLTTTNFYDNKERLIQVQSENFKGGLDVTTNLYDFAGKVLTSYVVHSNPASGGEVVRVKTNYEFDHTDRLLQVYKTINDAPSKLLTVNNSYDNLGQLSRKELGVKNRGGAYESPLEIQQFQYNARGWLRGVNLDYVRYTNYYPNSSGQKWFGYELCYDFGFNKRQYNGNIAGILWRTAGAEDEPKAYGFGYDNANRLLFADFYHNKGTYFGGKLSNFSVHMGNGVDPTTAYDENGNIKAMKTWGLKLSSSVVIDDLAYKYEHNGSSFTNKLKNVVDAENEEGTTLGDFRSSQKYMSYLGGTKTTNATDYTYDKNGNLKRDLNKDIGDATTEGIRYNHLNLPFEITVLNNNDEKGKITYIYDALGNKLEKRVKDNTNPTNPFKNTTYIGGFVYESDKLQFLSHEEGRIRLKETLINNTPVKEFIFDYFLKDHLGNVRMVLTEEVQTDIYPIASLENTGAVNLEKQFYRIDPVNIVDKSAVFGLTENYPNNNGFANNNFEVVSTANSQKMYRLHGSGAKMGLGITLKVMAGDEINIFARSYWKTANDSLVPHTPSEIAILDLLKDFVSSGVAGKGAISGEQLNSIPGIATSLTSFLSSQPYGAYKSPKAYLNWILFDENFKPIIVVGNSNSGFEAVSAASGLLSFHSKSTGKIKNNGYLYVFCNNQSNIDVFFDNLQVVHKRGALLEETHYYPFGLTMAGISSKAFKGNYAENKRGYNGNELQSKEFSDGSGLDVYDFNARSYDQQIGRFLQIDPLSDEGSQETLTPFQFSYNNPVRYNDPDGKCPSCVIGGIIGALVEYGSQVVANRLQGKSWSESLTDVDGGAIAISAGAGFVSSGTSAFIPKGVVGKVVKKGVEVTIDAGESMLQQYNETGTVSFSETAKDIFANQVGGRLTENVKVNSSDAIKTSEKQLDRAKRVSSNDPASSGRAATLKKAENKLAVQNGANQAANQAAAGTASSVIGEVTTSSTTNNKKLMAPEIKDKPLIDNTSVRKVYAFYLQ